MHFREKIKTIDINTVGFFFIILLCGFILRCYNITYQSYWLDELVSAFISNPSNSLSEVYSESLKGAPPLYQILLWGWYHIFGYNELSGRLLSLTLGTLSIVGIFFLGKELFNKQVGLYSALLLSLNQFSIYYSQEVRAYGLLLLVSILATYLLIRLLRTSNKVNLILYSLSIGSTFYTHYFGFFVLISHVFFMLIFNRKWIIGNLRIVFYFALFLFILIFPLAKNILELSQLKEYWVAEPDWNFWLFYFNAYFKSKILSIIVGALIIFGLFKTLLYSKTSQNENVWLLVLLIFLTYLLSYLRSVFSTPLLTVRNTIVVLPPIVLLISFGISKIHFKRMKVGLILLIIILSSHQFIESSYYFIISKQNWKAVLLEVKNENPLEPPVYDIVYHGHYYKTYAQLLKLDMRIHDKQKLEDDLKNSKLAEKFWLLDAHQDNFSNLKFLPVKTYIVEKEINYKNAKAILLRKDN